jgi:hypothetical protein
MPRPRRSTGQDGTGFLLPFGHRPSLLEASCPARGFRPSYDRPTAPPPSAARTRAGFPCSARVRRGRGRAPSVPRGRRCLHGHVCIPYPPPAALQRLVPVTPVQQPVPGCSSHEASARVHWRSPLPAFPSPVTPGRIGGPRALPRASHPAGQDPAAHAGAGTSLRHWPGVTSPPSTAASFLDAPTHYERHHVAMHGEERSSSGEYVAW